MRTRPLLVSAHAVAGALALLIMIGFWGASAGALLALDGAAAATVKDGIAWGLLALLPALIAAGASGAGLARGRAGPVVAAKQARMRRAAALGLSILAPAALVLAFAEEVGLSGWGYGLIQGAELVAGAINIALLSLNLRDGLTLRRRRRSPGGLDRKARPAAAG